MRIESPAKDLHNGRSNGPTWDLMMFFPGADRHSLRRALLAAFQRDDLLGPFRYVSDQLSEGYDEIDFTAEGGSYLVNAQAVAQIGGHNLPCGVTAVEHLDDVSYLQVNFFAGNIAKAWPESSEIEDGAFDEPWRTSLDGFLADVARTVWATQPFRSAVIGFDIPEELSDVPAELWDGLLKPSGGGLVFYPANIPTERHTQ